jgi:hypothetical protein
MRAMLRLVTLASMLSAAVLAFPGCSSDEAPDGKMSGGGMETGKMVGAMEGGKMQDGMTGKMDGAMDKGKMSGAMDKDKMDGAPK